MNEETKFTVEEVDAVHAPPRARVDDAETPAAKLERKRDYLEGFLQQKPQDVAPGEPGGSVYDGVIAALKDIYDPEIPVNIYDLGLIYGVEIDAGRSGAAGWCRAGCARCRSQPGLGSAVGSGQDER